MILYPIEKYWRSYKNIPYEDWFFAILYPGIEVFMASMRLMSCRSRLDLIGMKSQRPSE